MKLCHKCGSYLIEIKNKKICPNCGIIEDNSESDKKDIQYVG